jgi:protein-disulfide isomerase
VTEDEAIAAAVSHGADEAALREEMQNPEIIAAFQETYALADQLSITGTPSYVLGSEVVFGAMGQEVLTQKIEEVRAENPS